MENSEMTATEHPTLKDRYQSIQDRIKESCDRCGRDADEITLIAVSKTFPVSHVQDLYALGHRDFGENKVQEMLDKKRYLDETGEYDDIRWHLIGHLQRNKARQVVGAFHLFHGLDSERLARELNARAEAGGHRVDCLLQVNISGEDSKYGASPKQIDDLVVAIRSYEHISIRGFMGMARASDDSRIVKSEFKSLKEIAERQSSADECRILSMGMSQDYELAIEEGATHIRIGSAIFGSRAHLT
jgi:pyridoxal phosphate enzyme (YggS family)